MVCGSAPQNLVPAIGVAREEDSPLQCETTGTRCQGREERERFKFVLLTEPEFHEIMVSVDLMLYKMKGKVKSIKSVY